MSFLLNKKYPILIIAIIVIVLSLGLVFHDLFKGKSQINNSVNSSTDNSINNSSNNVTALPQKVEEVSVIAVGDIMLSRDVAKKLRKNGNDYCFLKVKDFLNSADLVFANLETPITPGREIQTSEMVFRSDPGIEKEMKDAGISIVSLANNHTPNFGTDGLFDTFKYLDEVGIKYVGAGENRQRAYSPVYLEKNGLKFAFLAYTDGGLVPESYLAQENHPGIAFIDEEKMRNAIKEAREKSDFVIISMHAGNEYVLEPSELQKQFAHAAVDAGADLVIGHHPHVVQSLEQYKDKYIFYSLGNFIFDQMWSTQTRRGVAIKFTFTNDSLSGFEPTPIIINDYCQPNIVSGEQADEILNRLKLENL